MPHFERAEAADVTPGVGIAVYGGADGVEHNLRVNSGADLQASACGANSGEQTAAPSITDNGTFSLRFVRTL